MTESYEFVQKLEDDATFDLEVSNYLDLVDEIEQDKKELALKNEALKDCESRIVEFCKTNKIECHQCPRGKIRVKSWNKKPTMTKKAVIEALKKLVSNDEEVNRVLKEIDAGAPLKTLTKIVKVVEQTRDVEVRNAKAKK